MRARNYIKQVNMLRTGTRKNAITQASQIREYETTAYMQARKQAST